MRTTTLFLSIITMVLAMAVPAFAAHEANNKFDMAVTVAGPATGDATGISNYAAGQDKWVNHIAASGLLPMTDYTWVGIAAGTASAVCSFTTDAAGNGSCTSDVNSRLGATEVREGGVSGVGVLRAIASTDDNNTVEDGEIERRGTTRDQ